MNAMMQPVTFIRVAPLSMEQQWRHPWTAAEVNFKWRCKIG